MNSELEYTIRPLREDSEYTEFESLQRETWGADIEEIVTGPLAKIVQKIGGIAAGSFDRHDALIGTVFGFTGVRDGIPVHWSHMLAVKDGNRNKGIGTKLKLYQRTTLLRMGVPVVYWTYDPLVAKNAQMNFNILGAGVLEYSTNMYGSGDDSKLFRGIGTDRFVVIWQIDSERIVEILDEKHRFDHEPFVTAPMAVYRTVENDRASSPAINLAILESKARVEIPEDIHELMSHALACAADWRFNTREAFQYLLMRGYRVKGFYRDAESGRCFYCLEKLD